MLAKPDFLYLSQFVQTANTANVLSQILDYEIPRGRILAIDESRHGMMRLATKELKSGYTINTASHSLNISFKPAKVTPHSLVAKVLAGTTELPVIDIDPQAQTITVDASGLTLPWTGDVTIYYAVAEGIWEMVLEIPTGGSTVKRQIASGSLADVNNRHQIDQNSAVRFNSIIALGDMNIQIYVKSPAIVNFESELSNLQIPIIWLDEEILMMQGITPKDILAELLPKG